jgi:hypothetical protein
MALVEPPPAAPARGLSERRLDIGAGLARIQHAADRELLALIQHGGNLPPVMYTEKQAQ